MFFHQKSRQSNIAEVEEYPQKKRLKFLQDDSPIKEQHEMWGLSLSPLGDVDTCITARKSIYTVLHITNTSP